MHERGVICKSLVYSLFCPNLNSRAMAYCLRALPPDAVALIEELRSHWVDLAGLRAAGGTPSARVMKGVEFGYKSFGATLFVVINRDIYVRRVVCNSKNRCWTCFSMYQCGRLDEDDLWSSRVCVHRRLAHMPWFPVWPDMDTKVRRESMQRQWRRDRDAA